jgi:hypothetical protein
MSYYALTLGGGGGGSGTVTSVSWTGGIVSIATATTTPAFTIAGTSGGIVYFDSATTWASSGVLTNNALIKGGGAGGAPSSVTTGTGVLTALGVNTGSAGAFVVNGGDLGTPSAGVVTNLTGTASININGTVGATTANTGTFSSTVHKGATSGTVTIAAPAVAGTQSYTLPSAVPAANGYALTATTGGVMSWSAITASAGGSTTYVQYNNAGALAGSANLTFDGTNLGVGGTLNTWLSSLRAIQIGVGAIWSATTGNNTLYGANVYTSTSATSVYITNGFATRYQQVDGTHVWYTAPSGTAGNTVTFTQPMTLDASGYLTIPAVYGRTVTTPRNVFIDSSGNLGGISSIRESKTNITPLNTANWIYQLNPVTFNYRKKDEDGKFTDEFEPENQFGLIAEEVESIAPDLCIYVNGALQGIHYDRMIAPLIKVIQELTARLEALEARVV